MRLRDKLRHLAREEARAWAWASAILGLLACAHILGA
jgi:hypothetical protein